MKAILVAISVACAVIVVAAPTLAGEGTSVTMKAEGATASPFIDVGEAAGTCCPSTGNVCCDPKWRVFSDFLYIRPGSEAISYGVPINGAIVPPSGVPAVEVGKKGVVDIDFQPGFRLGFGRAVSDCAEVVATYSYFNGDDSDSMAVTDPFVLRSLVNHPGTVSAPTDFLTGTADSQIRFHLVDIDYRRVLLSDSCSAIRWLGGVRYAHLGQSFNSEFTNVTTIENVNTNVDFDGFGIRVGLEGERRSKCGFLVYGRGTASFVGGRFRTDYLQADNFRGTVVDTGGHEDRLVSMLDLELGLGWSNATDRVRIMAGYMASAWYNTIRNNQFISSMQTTEAVDLNNTLTFDGLFVRGELRF